MDFEKWFLRNGFGVEVKENYRKCCTKGIEVNVLFTRRHVEGNEISFRVMIK